MSFSDLEIHLKIVEYKAKSSKIGRFLDAPWRYASSQLHRTIVFPFTKKGILRQAQTFTGYPLSILLPAGLDIYLTGGKTHDSEIRLARFMIQYCEHLGTVFNKQRTFTFVDIGAHVGYFSLLAAVLIKNQGRVFSFEAAKGTFDLLEKNLKPHANTKTFHNAVTDVETDLTFYEFPVLYSEYNTLHAKQFENESWYQRFKPEATMVKGITLDHIFEEFALKNPLIKIDTEGAEAQVIKGGIKALSAQTPVIVMEFLTKNNEPHKEAFKILNALNYEAHFIKPNGSISLLSDIDNYFKINGLDSDNFVFIKTS